MLGFNRVDFSKRMRHIVEQLQPVRQDVTLILQSCDPMTIPDIAQSRPITTGQSVEPKLYGRDHIMDTIIHDMTKGKYLSTGLTVLPVVGPGGIGKTTLIQHIYHNKEVQNHFHVVIWVCVSHSFNLNKLLEDIKTDIPRVEGEKGDRPEELIPQRLKSKRFLLVLDDIWKISNEDDWKRLLLPLKKSQEEGSVIVLTTRFPAIAKIVNATNHIELKGLESEEFKNLFLAFIIDEPFRSDQKYLLGIGDKIMEKLKGSPLAAKTVGTLLRKDLSLRHWRSVLESKEWETQTEANDIMPALKLSYDHLTSHQQQCFSYSALFPEDYKYSAKELINLWIGLDILQPGGWNQTLEDIGLSILNDLIAYGFFEKEETDGHVCYIMHDLLHDLAWKVASHECLSVHHSNVSSVKIHPSIRHLSIIIDCYKMSHENFKRELRNLKTRLKVKHLQSSMLFGSIDENFDIILGYLFREANALRVLSLVDMPFSVESMLPNFSALVHLRYLCLQKDYDSEMQLPLAISKFYHLKILDLGKWNGCYDLPRELANLAKLYRIYVPIGELHSGISNVEKLRVLEELKVFRVNKESEGFEPSQLEYLTELRELGIYNLEKIHKKEAAAKVKLVQKTKLERLTLDWDSKRSNVEASAEIAVLESLQTHIYLQELCIRGHGGPSCPTWLGDKLAFEALESLHLSGIYWQCLPPLGKMLGLRKLKLEHIAIMEEFVIEESFCRLTRLELVGLGGFGKWVASQGVDHMFPLLQVLIISDCPKLLLLPFSNYFVDPKPDEGQKIGWFPKLQVLEISNCPELMLVARVPWTETLCRVEISDVKLLRWFRYNTEYSSLTITGKSNLQSLDEVVAFGKMTKEIEQLELKRCPPLQSEQFSALTSLKRLHVDSSDVMSGLDGSDGEDDVEPCGKDLSELLTHLPRLSILSIRKCRKLTQLALGVDVQQTMLAIATTATEVEQEKEEDDSGLLLLPAHLSDTLKSLSIEKCPELVLVDPRGAGGLHALRSLQRLWIFGSPKLLSAQSSFSGCLFPSSLQDLTLHSVKGMGTLEPLSNLNSLTQLELRGCGRDLSCKGLGPLLTTGAQLRHLEVFGSPRFFAGRDPRQDNKGEKKELQQLVSSQSSSKLQKLRTDDAMGLLSTPICSLLSSSLTELNLYRTEMEHFTKEQEDALHLLSSLKELEFRYLEKLQSLPTGLHKLTNLEDLTIHECPALRSLPNDGLPKSLRCLCVSDCGDEELKQQCRGLVGTIPYVMLDLLF
ncbi:hypothetical protein CFC21_106220 [Triticum aestivum]|uniref:AAA+ ATPase domain-containing protein n=3 Tax=Triticum aestivum TaxID=4565 RepID=A0A9R1MDM6_WHEAT|nr:hypothetical protein CFC21_106220 [Triticum aestivum]